MAEGKRDRTGREEYYSKAARLFEQAAQLDPGDAEAQLGLGNVEHAIGNLDGAISAYKRAAELMPTYTAAYHDMAAAYEGRMKADPTHASELCQEALDAWRQAYQLVPSDPGFPADYHTRVILPRIRWLEQKCG